MAATASTHSLPTPSYSPWRRGWRRFRAQKMALVGLGWLILFAVVALFGREIAPYPLQYANLFQGNQGPSLAHPFGTNNLGQDMLTLIMYGMRYTLAIGLGATAVALVVGVLVGVTAGMAGGGVDEVLMRFTDFMYAFPGFLFAIMLIHLFGQRIEAIIIVFGITQWAAFARLARGLALTVRHSDLVESGHAIGASGWFIGIRYILPQVVNHIIVYTAFAAVNIITLQAEMSLFFGTGPPLPAVSFGALVMQGTQYVLGYPWLLIFPVAVLISLLVALILVGEGLQAALSPRTVRL